MRPLSSCPPWYLARENLPDLSDICIIVHDSCPCHPSQGNLIKNRGKVIPYPKVSRLLEGLLSSLQLHSCRLTQLVVSLTAIDIGRVRRRPRGMILVTFSLLAKMVSRIFLQEWYGRYK